MKKQFFYGLLALSALFGVGFADAMRAPDPLPYSYNGTSIVLEYGNIERVDFLQLKRVTPGLKSAIVNAAKPTLNGGSGVDGAIHKAAGNGNCGQGTCFVCQEFKGKRCDTGNAVFGKSHNINKPTNHGIDHIIHAVGPDCRGITVTNTQKKQLANAYYKSLQLAVNNGITHIAFPQISVGIYSFPHAEAMGIVVGTIKQFIDNNLGKLKQIRLVMYTDTVGRAGYRDYQLLLKKLEQSSTRQQREAATKQQPKQQNNPSFKRPVKKQYPVKKQINNGPSFFSKYKTSIIIGGVGLGIIATALIASMFSK